MAANSGGFYVDPGGETVVVNITLQSGGSVTVYGDAALTTPVSLPETINSLSNFFFASKCQVNVSLQINSKELATRQAVVLPLNIDGGFQGIGAAELESALEALWASGGGGFSSGPPNFTFSTTNAAGVASTGVLTDATIALFDATAPTTSAVGDAAAVGAAGKAARRDHTHGREGFGTPGSSAVGDAAAAGSAATVSHSDHTHGREGFGTPVAVGGANSAGTATTVSHSDHVHDASAKLTSTGFATPNLTLGTANSAGVATTVIRSDATLLAFDATAPTTSAVGDSAAVGSAAFAARRDHTHGREAFATNAIVLGTAAAAGVATTLMRRDDTIAAFDATVPTTSAVGDAAATGSVAKAARRDHVHGREAFATPVAVGSANAAGSAATINHSDHVHAYFPRTQTIQLTNADTPDGTGTVNAAARPEKIVNSGTQTTNAPKATFTRWLFDPSTDQHLMFPIIIPQDYTSGGTLRLKWSNKGTTNNVVWKGAVAQATDASTNMETGNTVFDTVATTTTAAPGTIGQITTTTITLAGSYTAGRFAVIMVGRDADNASDNNTSDSCLEAVTFEYTN